ncbi:MAG: DUF2511 domain-containing protein [Cyanobacteria bacterium J06635_11]
MLNLKPWQISMAAVCLLSLSCAGAPEQAAEDEDLIQASDWGEEWAFAMDEALLKCDDRFGPKAVFIETVDGERYGLNGAAQAVAEELNIMPLEIEGSIWKDGPDEFTPKVSLSPFIEEGLEKCD